MTAKTIEVYLQERDFGRIWEKVILYFSDCFMMQDKKALKMVGEVLILSL